MKVSGPLVSVVIPAYNAASDIRQTLESVAAQTYASFEAIVVDDGSRDATGAVVEDFARHDARFHLMRQPNAGVGAARNTALRMAHGKYVAPLDADDLWSPLKLEKQVACMEETGERTGLVYCWSAVIDERGNRLDFCHPDAVEGRVHGALLLRNFVGNASTPLFRMSALQAVGHYLTRGEQGGAQGCEDWDLYLRIAERFDFRVVPDYLVDYRQTGSCMSHNTDGMESSYGVVTRRMRERNRQLRAALFRWSVANFHFYLLRKCYLWGNYPRALRFMTRAVSADPALLLSSRLHRIAARSVYHLLTDEIRRWHALAPRPARPAPAMPKSSNPAPIPRWALHERLFERIQSRRWSSALRESTIPQAAPAAQRLSNPPTDPRTPAIAPPCPPSP